MLASAAQFTVLDFETTGTVKGLPSDPWQLGMIAFCDGKPRPEETFDSLLHIGNRPFSPYAPGRHALIRDRLETAPSLAQVWPALRPWFAGRILVAHNVATERNCLTHAFPLHPFGPWVDTLTLVRIAYPTLANHKLERLIDELGLAEQTAMICPGREAHDALFDAVACAVLLEHLLALPGWEDASVQTLVQATPTAYHRKRASQNRH